MAELALRGTALLARLLLGVMDNAAPAGLLDAASLLHDNALLVPCPGYDASCRVSRTSDITCKHTDEERGA